MWIINDENVAKRIYEYISIEALSDLYERCDKYGDFEYIYIAKGGAAFPKSESEFLRVCKRVFEWVDYDPEGWNQFPKIQPPKNDVYLVTRKDYYGKSIVSSVFWDKRIGWNNLNDSDVLAFMEYPKPYQKPDEDEGDDDVED